jgi:tRNA/rRNA methyltransferase
VMTTGRVVPGTLTPEETAARLLACPSTCALVFGDEVRGLTNRDLQRAGAVATIPTAHKSSVNLAQAVLVFGYEILKARDSAAPPVAPEEPLADERLLSLLRERARALLLASDFLNPQQPDLVLDELVSLARRARPTRREVELLLAAVAQLQRTRSF